MAPASVSAPLPAVVIPVYNAAPELNRCLQTVCATVPPGTDVLIIDDASPDPAVAAVYSRADLESGDPAADPWLAAARKSWHPERSADLQLIPKPGWMFGSYGTGTTHGSPHPYDTHVPILLYGPKWVRPGRVAGRPAPAPSRLCSRAPAIRISPWG